MAGARAGAGPVVGREAEPSGLKSAVLENKGTLEAFFAISAFPFCCLGRIRLIFFLMKMYNCCKTLDLELS